MKFSFFNPFFICIAIFLLIYSAGYLPFFNALSAGIALGIIVNIIYPHIRGVKKGDVLSVSSGPSLSTSLPNIIQIAFGAMFSISAIASQNGKKGEIINVLLEDGTDAKGLITNYAGIFSSAEIKLIRPPKVVSPHAEIEIH